MTPELNPYYVDAKKGNDTAIGVLADKLAEDEHPLAPLYRAFYDQRGFKEGNYSARNETGGHFNHTDSDGHLVQHGFYIKSHYPGKVIANLFLGGWSGSKYNEKYSALVSIEDAIKAVSFLESIKNTEARLVSPDKIYRRMGGSIDPNNFAQNLTEDFNYENKENYARLYSKIIQIKEDGYGLTPNYMYI